MSIVDITLNTRGFKILSTVVQITDFNKTLNSAGYFTIFAPTDRAFMQLSKINLQHLIEDIPLLTKTLGLHIISGKLKYHDLLKMCKKGEQKVTVKTINGLLLHIDLSDGIIIGNSTVVSTDISVDNIIIHPIDQLLSFE